MKLEDIQPGQAISGIVPGKLVNVVAAEMRGGEALELTYSVEGLWASCCCRAPTRMASCSRTSSSN